MSAFSLCLIRRDLWNSQYAGRYLCYSNVMEMPRASLRWVGNKKEKWGQRRLDVLCSPRCPEKYERIRSHGEWALEAIFLFVPIIFTSFSLVLLPPPFFSPSSLSPTSFLPSLHLYTFIEHLLCDNPCFRLWQLLVNKTGIDLNQF